jgi:hypothetical protein
VLLGTAVAVGTWFYHQGTAEALLARASNERRVTELYLPGSAPRPLDSPTLGQPDTEDVLPLLQLKERARRHLDKNPNDAYWRQVEGRIALRNGGKAAKELELALALNPALGGIKLDLAEVL